MCLRLFLIIDLNMHVELTLNPREDDTLGALGDRQVRVAEEPSTGVGRGDEAGSREER